MKVKVICSSDEYLVDVPVGMNYSEFRDDLIQHGLRKPGPTGDSIVSDTIMPSQIKELIIVSES